MDCYINSPEFPVLGHGVDGLQTHLPLPPVRLEVLEALPQHQEELEKLVSLDWLLRSGQAHVSQGCRYRVIGVK